MKRGNPCVKCDSTSILFVPGGLLEDQSHATVGALLPVRFRIARYVCTNCGYIEEWVDREDDLARVRSLAAQ